MSTILVTGGAGFIGSHVARAYLALGHRVVIVDDLSSGKEANAPAAAEFYRLSVLDPALDEVFQKVRPDVVNHHAAHINLRRSVREPAFDANINVVGSAQMLDMAARHGVKRFIFASTGGALYGEPRRLPCTEEHPFAPLSPYGVAKWCVEQYIGYYQRTQGLATVILRYANVYGPGQDPNGEAGVVAIFAQRMLKGEPVFINGTGDQERDFVYVEDVARANELALDRGEGGAYNIGVGQGTSVKRIFELLAKETKYKLPAIHKPASPGEVFRITLNASKARRELGWEPKTSLQEGMRKTVRHFTQA